MAEYIKREALKKAISEAKSRYCSDANIQYLAGNIHGLNVALGQLCMQPAADVVPVVHARWVQIDDDVFACSHCRADWVFSEATPEEMKLDYCPQCGAIMDGTADG